MQKDIGDPLQEMGGKYGQGERKPRKLGSDARCYTKVQYLAKVRRKFELQKTGEKNKKTRK